MLVKKRFLNVLSTNFYRKFTFISKEKAILNNEWRQQKSIQAKLVTNDLPFDVLYKLQRNKIDLFNQISISLINCINHKNYNSINIFKNKKEFLTRIIVGTNMKNSYNINISINTVILTNDTNENNLIIDLSNKFLLSALHLNDEMTITEIKELIENKGIEILSCSFEKFIEILKHNEKLLNFNDIYNLVILNSNTIIPEKLEKALIKDGTEFRYHLFIEDTKYKYNLEKIFKPFNSAETKFHNNFIGESMFSSLEYSAMSFKEPKLVMSFIKQIYSENMNKKTVLFYDTKMYKLQTFIEYFKSNGISYKLLDRNQKIEGDGIYLIQLEKENDYNLYNLFDNVIEIPFVNQKTLMRRRNLLRINAKENKYYFVFTEDQLSLVQELQAKHLCSLKIENYLVTEESIGENIKCLVETLEKKIKQNNLMNEKCHEYLQKNTILRDRIIDLFFSQNKSLLIKLSKPISLISGEEGVFTTRISYLNSKNHDDRYYIPKFLLTEKISTIEDYDKKILRVADSFDYICDVKGENIEEFKSKAEQNDLSVTIIESLPDLYLNPYADKYKILKDHNVLSDGRETENVLKSLKTSQ